MWALKDLCRVSSLRLLYIYYMSKSTARKLIYYMVHRPFWGKNLQKILAFFLGFTMYLHHAEIYFEKLASMYVHIALLFFLIFHQKYTQKSQVIKSQYFLRFFNFKKWPAIVQFFVYSKKIYLSVLTHHTTVLLDGIKSMC